MKLTNMVKSFLVSKLGQVFYVPIQFLSRHYQSNLTSKSLYGQFLRKWRRFVLGTFFSERVKASISQTRQGECHRCGACCELLFRCPFLGRDAQQLPYCRIYGDLRPANCHIYPFDKVDSEIEQCGYRFKD